MLSSSTKTLSSSPGENEHAHEQHADSNLCEPNGNSTDHTGFAPTDPTQQDPSWPRVLVDIVKRLVSTASGTLTTDTQSLSPANIEPPNADADRRSRTESNPGHQHSLPPRPTKRDTHSNDQTLSAGARDELSRDRRLGDSEMPDHEFPSHSTVTDKVQPPGHSEWQSLKPPALLAHSSSPPDEQPKAKRVADSERYHQTLSSQCS